MSDGIYCCHEYSSSKLSWWSSGHYLVVLGILGLKKAMVGLGLRNWMIKGLCRYMIRDQYQGILCR